MQPNQNPLVDMLETVANEVERLANALDDVMWNAFVETEQRTVGQLLDHIVWAWEAESAAFRRIADGASGSGWTQEWLDAQNAEQARLSAERNPKEIQRQLHEARERAVAFVSSLSPEELARRGTHMPGEPERTVAGWIEVCLIGHPREHLPEIRAAIARPRS
jgi:hypothetical protein